MEGFKTDISKCRKAGDLPDAALRYIHFIEDSTSCPVKYVSVGAGRDDYLLLR
jgi:adenylosuccinate synthase